MKSKIVVAMKRNIFSSLAMFFKPFDLFSAESEKRHLMYEMTIPHALDKSYRNLT